MAESTHQVLALALARLLRPLIRVLLRNGMAFHAFADVARKVYVDVAFAEFAPARKKQTVSNVSVLTGLTRKEVKRLREMPPGEDAGGARSHTRALRVISGWLRDPSYQDADGRPAELPLEGPEGSFARLVREHSGDIPTRAMLEALEDGGSVEVRGQRVRLVQSAYIPAGDPVEGLRILGTDGAELIATIAHNLAAASGERRFQRKVSHEGVTPEALAACEGLVRRRGQELLEELDAILAAAPEGESDAETRTVSVGLYFYQSDADAPD